jgi:precorrin-6A/cobalt-precorrin-6A reductase
VTALRVLVLGGTGDALALAARLHAEPGIAVTSSLAGRVARPRLPPGEVRIGGFGGPQGLAVYLRDVRFDAVIDATHPFAATISRNAVLACALAGVPLLALERPRWTPSGDCWQRVPDVAAAALRARELGMRIFLTIGRAELAPFAAIADRWFLIRAIEAPEAPLPPHHTLVLGRGPFTLANEREILRAHAIDVVVSKDSGGDATVAKLAAARDLGIPVVVVDRPPGAGAPHVADVDAAVAWLAAEFLIR